LRRGTPLALVPTTLRRQIDAAVGVEHGINLGGSKKLVGGIHHPDLVLVDPGWLSTQDHRGLVCGTAEAIKVLAVADPAAYAHLRAVLECDGALPTVPRPEIVWTALSRKLDLLAEDPFETSSRRLLNYGHAFAHHFEEGSGFQLAHGEAVLLGMLIENEVSRGLGIGADDAIDGLQRVIRGLLTPACRDYWCGFDAMAPRLPQLRLMRRGLMNLVCLECPGRARIVDDADDGVLGRAWAGAERWLAGVTT
ncbi:MAG: hypothetical protein WEC33_07355, partial [Dehalococcoidia bacterium]